MVNASSKFCRTKAFSAPGLFFGHELTSSTHQECVRLRQHDVTDGPNHSHEIGGLPQNPLFIFVSPVTLPLRVRQNSGLQGILHSEIIKFKSWISHFYVPTKVTASFNLNHSHALGCTPRVVFPRCPTFSNIELYFCTQWLPVQARKFSNIRFIRLIGFMSHALYYYPIIVLSFGDLGSEY